MKQLPFFELTIDETDDETRVQANAFVDVPAHLKNFIAFTPDKVAYDFNEEKRMVLGVMISAGTPIYRHANQLIDEPHNVVFKAETVAAIRKKFMLETRGSEVNEMHDEHRFVEGVHLVDSYLIGGDKNPTVPEVFKDMNLQDGTWIASYHVENDEVWAKVKSGEFNGFSVEGIFDIQPLAIKKKFIAKGKFGTIAEVDKWDIEVDQDAFEVGTALTTTWIDETGESHVQKVRDGEYMLETGQRILVDSDGVIHDIFKANTKRMKKKKKPFSLLGITFGGTPVAMVDVTAVDGTILSYEGDLAEGTAVFITDENEEQLPAPAGEYAIEMDGVNWLVTIDDNGMVSALEEVEAEPEMGNEDFTAENFAAFMEQYDAKQTEKFKALEDKNTALAEENAGLKKSIAHMQAAMNSKFSYTPRKADKKSQTTVKDLLNKN